MAQCSYILMKNTPVCMYHCPQYRLTVIISHVTVGHTFQDVCLSVCPQILCTPYLQNCSMDGFQILQAEQTLIEDVQRPSFERTN